MTQTTRTYNRFVFVDWSAHSKQTMGDNSIWIGVCNKDIEKHTTEEVYFPLLDEMLIDNAIEKGNFNTFLKEKEYFVCNPCSRQRAFALLESILGGGLEENKNGTTIVGFDFGFGYPAWAYDKTNWGDEKELNWEKLWEKLHCKIFPCKDKSSFEEADRFEVASSLKGKKNKLPFWGKSSNKKKEKNTQHLQSKKDKNFYKCGREEFRLTEDTGDFGGFKSSQWQLMYRGSVGSQTLIGIPYVYQLREHLKKDNVKVWPFETEFGEKLPDSGILFCEIHFGAIKAVRDAVGERDEYPKDRVQVEEMCKYFAREGNERIEKFLNVAISFVDEKRKKTAEENKENARTKEGWILGVPICLQSGDG